MWQLKAEKKHCTEVTEVQPTMSAFKHRIILIFFFQIAFSNDQKTSTSTSYPSVLILTSQLSARDSASLTAVWSSYKISESMEKNNHSEALDWFFGEAFVGQYADWKCVWQIKPQGLKFFNFVVLTHVVHMEAPTYTALKDNCYWYVTTVIDAAAMAAELSLQTCLLTIYACISRMQKGSDVKSQV